MMQENLWFLREAGIEELLSADDSSVYVTQAQLGMTNNGADLQISVLPKIFPLKIGEAAPLGHHLKDPLPKYTIYPSGFVGWFKALHWAFIKNNKKPITAKDGDILNTTNWMPTLVKRNLAGKIILNHAKGANLEAFSLIITQFYQPASNTRILLLQQKSV